MEASAQDRSDRSRKASSTRKALTIGSVTKILAREFEDVSISKIRYLEDQKLLNPQRTPGGYRLYSQADVERLRAILRMQRDEFLPLRVIRQELATGNGRQRRTGNMHSVSVEVGESEHLGIDELCDTAGIDRETAAELEEYGILQPRSLQGQATYDDADIEIAKACAELARFGVAGRNLRVFRGSADREAGLIEQLVSPGLKSGNAGRRREARETIESLATVCSNLTQLLLVRDLRRLTGGE